MGSPNKNHFLFLAKGQNSEIINLFLVNKMKQNQGVPNNYNHEIMRECLIELKPSEAQKINKESLQKNINIININESDLEENNVQDECSDIVEEDDEGYDSLEEDNDEFLCKLGVC